MLLVSTHTHISRWHNKGTLAELPNWQAFYVMGRSSQSQNHEQGNSFT